jgi:hypothetical protein
MKIPTWVEPEPYEIEVEITTDDLRKILSESPETQRAAMMMINDISKMMKAIPSEIINEFSDGSKELIYNFLIEQAERFKVDNQ